MRKFEFYDSIITNLPRNIINEKLIDFFNQNQIKIKEMNDIIIKGLYGSRFKAHTRGILAEPSILPVKVLVNIQKKEKSTELDFLLKEGFIGMPSIFLKKKYELIFGRLMNKLKVQFFTEKKTNKKPNKCSNCGKAIPDENQRFCEECGYELITN